CRGRCGSAAGARRDLAFCRNGSMDFIGRSGRRGVMRLGIFARTFSRPTVEGVFDAVREHQLDCVQFNMACAGLPALPDEIAPALATRIHEASMSRGIEIAAVSGTYNMIHPDLKVRQAGLRRLRTLA